MEPASRLACKDDDFFGIAAGRSNRGWCAGRERDASDLRLIELYDPGRSRRTLVVTQTILLSHLVPTRTPSTRTTAPPPLRSRRRGEAAALRRRRCQRPAPPALPPLRGYAIVSPLPSPISSARLNQTEANPLEVNRLPSATRNGGGAVASSLLAAALLPPSRRRRSLPPGGPPLLSGETTSPLPPEGTTLSLPSGEITPSLGKPSRQKVPSPAMARFPPETK
ncbi:hypothetical protein GUJ93_ZPchr0003g17692 [Zizania palustris]|uniref:Uncharacterized protein n=1 Tax=Zizania palustris TaxID=103762 RepID=A0A8J5RS56_ZIZPA|nr:hypothetical protein GUJ93_ZPchr0003g17692 [Zizania palustris]